METPATIEITARPDSLKNVRVVVVAWVLTAVYYFYQYALRSAPGGDDAGAQQRLQYQRTGVASIVGLFYYGYSPFSLVAGAAMDRIGPRRLLPGAAASLVLERCCLPPVIANSPVSGSFSRVPAESLRLLAPSTSRRKTLLPQRGDVDWRDADVWYGRRIGRASLWLDH